MIQQKRFSGGLDVLRIPPKSLVDLGLSSCDLVDSLADIVYLSIMEGMGVGDSSLKYICYSGWRKSIVERKGFRSAVSEDFIVGQQPMSCKSLRII